MKLSYQTSTFEGNKASFDGRDGFDDDDDGDNSRDDNYDVNDDDNDDDEDGWSDYQSNNNDVKIITNLKDEK